ncbi:hypothetical protein RN96_05300 [Fusobacterium polymorphum]|uniref:IrrE N-terminal-like domain-containing protein n=1 Tax=Fusobacterium nucleatum subsp. polymorphum TaxID=76857 RepID=A0A2B7YNW0_FUSNP|nr:ImmA/IrrE family metallo-endopeptidase [Fusobacterium polymorphum]PGH22542.1 hypothetical protein RN96_05300 [Fusobacterium polymorphum]
MIRTNSYIQYNYAQKKAYEVLLKYSEGVLPIDPFKIIKKINNIELKTYTEFAKELQKKQPSMPIEEIKCQFESNRGFLKKKGKKKYILCYNEEDSTYVIRWTIFHELGHYFLEHLKEEYNYIFCDGERYSEIKEKEANCFARHCSSPLTLALYMYIEINNNNLKLLDLFRYFFNMSKEVSEYCSKHFSTNWMYYLVKEDDELITLFKNSINEKINNVYSQFEYMSLFGKDIWLYLPKSL